jgi:hypothetical protein
MSAPVAMPNQVAKSTNPHLDDPAAQAPRKSRYLTKGQRAEVAQDIANAQGFLGQTEPHLRPQVPNDVRRQIVNLNEMLIKGSPPELRGGNLDTAVRRRDELQERISGAMLSAEEMRKNPPGAVGKYLRQEASSRATADIMEWKNLQEAIYPESEDPDKCNIEMLRRHTSANDLNMDNAQISGASFSLPSDRYMQNYDAVFGAKPASNLKNDEPEELLSDDGKTMEEMRAELKTMLARLDQTEADDPETRKRKNAWTPEKRAEASARSLRQHAERRALKTQGEDEEPSGFGNPVSVAEQITEQLAAEAEADQE